MSGTGIAIAFLIGNVAVPALHSASGAQDAGDVEVISARSDAAERMTVQVQIGDSRSFRFLVDTGAQNTVVSSALAAELALPAGPTARVISIAGSQMVSTVEIDEMQFGRRSAYGLRAPLFERAHIGADGILGIDSLRGQRVLFDFKKNLIALQEARKVGSSGYEIVVRGRRRGGQLLITDAKIDGVRTDVVIDTGAEASIGNRALQRAIARRMQSRATTLTSVTGQQIPADVGIARELNIGALNIRNVAIAFADAPAFDELDLEKKPALLLGIRELRAFNRVAIDFSTWRVLFDLPGF